MNDVSLPQLRTVDLIHFQGLAHLVYELAGDRLISLRPLVDQIGIDWRTQKKTLLDDDNLLFYGVLAVEAGFLVQPPCKYEPKNAVSASYTSEEGRKIALFCAADAQKDTLLIRLQRVHMYLARISIGHVKGTGGNEAAARWLLDLHEEWATALHDYEVHGLALNRQHLQAQDQIRKQRAAFASMVGVKNKTGSPTDRTAISHLLKSMADEIGIPYQLDLVDDATQGPR